MNKDAAAEFRNTYKIDLVILLIAGLTGVFLFEKDAFDRLYDYTRAHEHWELDEYIIAFVSVLIGSLIVFIRHIFILKNANALILQFQAEKLQAEKMAALGEMSSGLAHEINNALQPAIGLSGIIQRKISLFDSQAAGYMDIISKSSQHAKQIVEDILLFSRGQNAECERLDIRPALERIAKEITQTIPPFVTLHTSGLELNSGKPFPIFANETSLHQIITNLVRNACHALQERTGNIWVSLDEQAPPDKTGLPPGRYARIQVRDDGCGMDERTLPLIFEPFFSTKKDGQGTGLGLSVVYGIIKNLGGAIQAESQLGKGTIFTIYLPLLEEEWPHA